jgi:choline dehydrogenase-like flavoprotein
MDANQNFKVDAVIVGSGVAGALIAKQLADAGKQVLILEAGPEIPPNVNDYMQRFFKAAAKVPESPYPPELFTDGKLTDPRKVNAGRATSVMLGSWKDPTQSYLVQTGPMPFGSTYERIGGGTSLHWLGTSLRFLPSDFKMRKLYNRFVDWPITYDDLGKGGADSWYSKAEAELGVSADAEDQGYLGIDPNDYAYPMPKIPLSRVDKVISGKVAGMSLNGASLTVRSTPAARNSRPYRQRRTCAGNTNCIPICPIQAKYDPTVTVNEALRLGVKIKYRSVVHNIVLDGDGRVSRIDFLQYGSEMGGLTGRGSVSATVFIVAGNAIETPRLLLMSKNEGRTLNGVANRSGMVGRNLMDHPYLVTWGLMSDQDSDRVFPYRGPLSTAGIEDLRDGPFRRDRGAFRIEIGNEGWNFVVGGVGSGDDPGVTTVDFVNGLNVSGLNTGGPNGGTEALFGSNLVKRLNNRITRQFRLGFLIEQSPDSSNRVTLSERNKDGLGLPRPQITYNLSEYTKKGLVAAKQASDAIFKKLNAQSFTVTPPRTDPSSFEATIDGNKTRIGFLGAGHIVGTYRMGDDPKQSVVDSFQRSHDHRNLYLVGSGTFPTVATANPTLTLAALCLRTADHIINNKDLK